MRKTLSIGFELELEVPATKAAPMFGTKKSENAIKLAKKTIPAHWGTIKYDGTIQNGFELASAVFPDSLFLSTVKLQKKSAFRFRDLFKKFAKMETTIGNHVGMHVHVGKNILTDEQIYKLNYFVFRNSEFVTIVGEREPTEYCAAMENADNCLGQFYNADWHKRRMLNIVRPTTVEFRFFKSTSDLNTFIKNMQFAIAMVRFAQEHPWTLDQFSVCGKYITDAEGKQWEIGDNNGVNAFVKFVRANRQDFRLLDDFLVDRKFLSIFKPIKNKKQKTKRAK